MEKKRNKYLYGWKIYVHYPGWGWECEVFEETYKGMRENLRAYRENCHYHVKVAQGRELNT